VGKTYSHSPAIEAAPLQDEILLFDPAKNQFCVLNRTASHIWNQLATPSSTESLAAGLCKSFSGVALEDAYRDTDKALQEMLRLNFVISQF
jgi:hypothetical protein